MEIVSKDFSSNIELEGRVDNTPQLGQWYWVLSSDLRHSNELEDRINPDKETFQWLGCVTKLGSNYVEINHPSNERSSSSERILLTKTELLLELEPNASEIIKANVQRFQAKSLKLMNEIQNVTSRLGVSQQLTIEDSNATTASTALTVLNEHNQVDIYKTELIKAKEETLPNLFEEMKKSNTSVAKWMKAETLTYSSQLGTLQETIGRIDSRIFNVSLYAGLGEGCELIKDGEPAPFHSKIHIMQRKLFMDEECLLDYDAGGMEFKDICQFDEWLSRKSNFERIFGFERCLVAFQVRRDQKARYSNDSLSAFINFNLGKQDEFTFLYVRNGDRLYRVAAELEFEEMLFPTGDVMFNEPMMANLFCGKVKELMPVREYETLKSDHEIAKGKSDLWEEKNPDEHHFRNPNYSECSNLYRMTSDYELVNDEHLYFDEINQYISNKIEQYNRIVLIIQGLLDRSEVLHPHPAIKLHKPDDFHQMVKLVYDAEHVLTCGEAPDFEEYRQQCNLSINKESIFVGQEAVWKRQKMEKDSEQERRGFYGSHCTENGTGKLALAERIQPRAKRAVFTWQREKSDYSGGYVRKTITVPFESLLNVSAYQKGDYKRFYQDPRTRANYVKWACYLLAAEDYLNGKETPKLPNTF
jgi:hypothetical protein